jgi:hypothetical protein
MTIYKVLEKIKNYATVEFQSLFNEGPASVFLNRDAPDLDYLKEDNWGGNDEKKVPQKTLDNLYKLISCIPYYRGICPGPSGIMGVVYRSNKSYMYIEVNKNKSSIYIKKEDFEVCEEFLRYDVMLKKACATWGCSESYYNTRIGIPSQASSGYKECVL